MYVFAHFKKILFIIEKIGDKEKKHIAPSHVHKTNIFDILLLIVVNFF